MNKGNLKTRVLSALVMAPLLAVIYIGNYVLAASCFVLTIFAMREFYNALKQVSRPVQSIGYVSITLLYAVTIVVNAGYFSNPVALWLIITVILCLCILLRTGRDLKDAAATFAGIIYVGFFVFHLYLIAYYYSPTTGAFSFTLVNLAWYAVFCAFGTDIFAFFAGTLFGKHKMAPNISPKKSVEGSIGGVLGSLLLCGLYGWLAMPGFLIHSLIIGAIGSGMAQLGDFCASAIKRRLDIKDFGKLIPGHGGILDRIDSLMFTAPAVYYYLAIYSYVNMLVPA